VPLLNVPDDERKSRFGLRTLLDTSRLLIESHDIDFILNNLLLISMGKLMVNRAAILWFHPKKNIHSVRTSKGRLNLPVEIAIRRDFFKKQATALCADHAEFDHICRHGIEMLIAIRNSERHFGFLALGPKMDRTPPSGDEVEVLESLVSMSAIAVSNSELVSELRATNRKLDYKVQELFTLFDLSKSFNASIDRDEIKRIFKFTLLGQLFVRRFFLVTMRRGEPRIESQNGLGMELDREQMHVLFALDRSIVMVDDDLRRRYPFLEQAQIHLILKINNEGQEPAVIGLGKRANGVEFEQTDLNFLISLGNLALMSIQKTYLLEDQIEKERMEEELSIARSIQQRLLPDNPPETPNLQIAATNVPSYQVGGDYYDLISDDNRNLTLAIADVTGKGVPASLLMANLQSVLHILQPFNIGLVEATGQINALIYQNTPSDKFISFFWGCYYHESRTLRYVNAGHNPPLLFRKGIAPQQLSDGGVLLGAMPTMMPYHEETVRLQKGDVIVMYTDGITEAMKGEEEFDERRLIACVEKRMDQHPEDIMRAIISDVTDFCDNRFTDDLTLIVCKVV
jgi:phosphoserine phosphatase RsbU/P